MLYPFCSSHFGLGSRNQSEKTTSLVKGTSLETIESQTQQELLYEDLENSAVARNDDPARTMLVQIAEAAVAQAATQSLLTLTDECMVNTVTVSKRSGIL